MGDNIFVYMADMPDTIHSACVPCEDGYNIYINAKLDDEHKQLAYLHELVHIQHGHLDDVIDVDMAEGEVHGATNKLRDQRTQVFPY